MSEQNNESLYRKQKKIRPKIEDVLNEYINGDILKNALEFVAWLKENKMSPAWGSGNSWSVTYKKVRVLYIKLYDNAWHICPSAHGEYFNDFLNSNDLKDINSVNLNLCKKCVHLCNDGSGYSFVIGGKKFDNICGHYSLRLRNLEADKLEIVKNVIKNRNRLIDAV